MSYILSSADGDHVAQHHGDPKWPQNRRLVGRMIRVMGEDPTTLDPLICDGIVVKDQPNSLGARNDAAVWYASGNAPPSLSGGGTQSSGEPRTVPLWANGYPGVVQPAPSGTTSDPYKSNVRSSTFALPAYAQDPSDPTAWLPDTGLLPQKVSVSGGANLPAGTQVMLVPFSITTEQQMAAIPASNQLVAVWFGGPPSGPLGTLEYDVRPDGSLDPQRRARIHSRDRIYRLPKGGLLSFGAAPGADAKPFPVSSGIAWQLGLDVDSQAGYGVIVDQVGGAPPPPPPNRTATGSGGADPGAATGGTVSPPTGVPQTQGTQSVLAVTGRRGFGGHSVGEVADKHLIAKTPDLEPVNAAHWNVLQPIDGDGFDAPLETSGIYRPPTGGGPLLVRAFFRYDRNTQHPFLGGTREGLRRWESESVFDVPPPTQTKTGLQDKAVADKGSDKATTDKGVDKTISDKNDDWTKIPRDDKNPASSDKESDFTKPPVYDKATSDKTGDAAKVISDFGQGQKSETVDKAVADSGAVNKAIEDFDRPDQVNLLVPGSLPFTFGGAVMFGSPSAPAGDPGTGATIGENRGYARTPLEVAVPGILGRPVPCNGPDARGRTSALSPAERASYEADAPISGVISAVGDQTGGSPRWFSGATPGSALYVGGVANAGGFALHPANTDVKSIQAGEAQPPAMPTTTLMAATLAAQFAVADPNAAGVPSSGYSWNRQSATVMQFDVLDAAGVPGANPGLALDSAAQDATSWGGTLANGKDGTAGQVPIADGAGGVTWGVNGGTTNPNCVYGDGSDGALHWDGAGAVAGFTGPVANVYTQTRDVYATTGLLDAGVTINAQGYRRLATTSLTYNGTVQANGVASVGAPEGTVGPGGTGATVGAAATANAVAGAGGGGGAGGTGNTAPGAGGVRSIASTTLGYHSYPASITGAAVTLTTLKFLGGGGGGGGGSNGGGVGGTGGGGGGVLIDAAPTITLGATAVVQANGGNGAAGGVVNAGGGGGGGGGWINLATPNLVTVAGYVKQALGGTGGAGGGGTGGAGVNGSAGTVTNIAP